jgi:hypothetical protein
MEHIAIYDYVIGQLQLIKSEEEYEKVARGSGVPKSTVKKIKWKQIKDPGVSHIEALANFFRAQAEQAAAT